MHPGPPGLPGVVRNQEEQILAAVRGPRPEVLGRQLGDRYHCMRVECRPVARHILLAMAEVGRVDRGEDSSMTMQAGH